MLKPGEEKGGLGEESGYKGSGEGRKEARFKVALLVHEEKNNEGSGKEGKE